MIFFAESSDSPKYLLIIYYRDVEVQQTKHYIDTLVKH
jgi:hypothetical protein